MSSFNALPNVLVRRTRRLPPNSLLVVKEGDTVTAVDAVATSKLQGKLHPIFAAQALGVFFSDLPSFMLVKEGDQIKKGQPLAEARSWFGLSKKTVHAPCDGTLKSVSAFTGQIMAAEEETTLTLLAYLPGRVVRAHPFDSVEIEATVSFVQGVFGIGGERFGRLIALDSWPKTASDLRDAYEGAILFSREPLSLVSLIALEQVGVAAAIAGSIPASDLMRFAGKTLNPACASEWRHRLCVIVTEGFGTLPMAENVARLFHRLNNQNVSVNGATQVRAGVIRPEIIGPPVEPESVDENNSDSTERNTTHFQSERSLSVGDAIRIIRGSHFGKEAKILSAPSNLEIVGSGAKALVYEVELSKGERIVVPRANVEAV